MSSMPCSNTAAERQHAHQQGLSDRTDTTQAIEALTERLKDGKRVGRSDFFDLLDSELNSGRYRIVLEDLGSLLLGGDAACDDRAAADKIRDGMIERYLNAHPELVEEEAAAIELAAAEDAQ